MLHKQKSRYDAQQAEYIGLQSVERFHLLVPVTVIRRRLPLQTIEIIHYSSRGADNGRQFAGLFDDAAKRKFDYVLFWALDRFS